MKNMRTMAIFGSGVLLASTAAYMMAMGPLDPPAGPVMETSPSLAEIETKLDQVIAQQGTSGETTGPWEVFRVPAVGALSDNAQGTLVAEGRVYVHSVTSHRSVLAIFDGQGSIDGGTHLALTSNWISRLSHYWSNSGGNGRGQIGTITVPVEQVVENGLYVAWDAETPHSYLYVLYKELP